ncbi:glycosyltransferase [Streptomyces sp. NPDC051172]|uniref:glycosyltransferase n=1 Tax=Streptomyces sp. NPDC051172 TaxID=3155796 RepID=UPI0034423353
MASTSALELVNFATDLCVYDGYGSMSEYIAVGMARAGVDLNVIPMRLQAVGLSQEMQRILARGTSLADGLVLYNSWPRPELERFAATEHFVHTMCEQSLLPFSSWAGRLNRARAVMVPTRFAGDALRNSGVSVPIEVVPDGVDPAVYPIVDRPIRDTFTTLIVGTVQPRKHFPEAISAWQMAFEADSAARLIIKTRFGRRGRGGLPVPHDRRITIVDESEPSRGILHWYAQADVLLALGNEGFGLPLVEGMSTGLPVIALSSEGQRDVCTDAGDLVLAVPPGHWERANVASLPGDPLGSGACGS